MNGLLDLNQVPNSLLQSIQYRTDDNRLTSGGSLSIRNTEMNQNMVAISSTSYLSELFSHKIDGNFQKGKSKFSFVNQLTHGRNMFDYINANNERSRIDHNAVQQINTQFFYTYQLAKWYVNTGFWYQNQDRRIPKSGFYPVQTQSLIDRNARVFAGVSNANWDIKLSYMSESQQYNDQNTAWGPPTESRHKVVSWKGLIQYQGKLNDKIHFNYNLYPCHYNVKSSSLQDSSTNILEAIQTANLKYAANDKLSLEGGLKSQMNTNFSNFFLPYAAIHYKLNQRWMTSLIADINERNPTMNDLYFQFYGNINLRPETNYQIRNSWKYSNGNTSDKIIVGLEPYYIRSIDKINYVPDSAFRVFNIDKTTTYGFNTNLEWVRKISLKNSLRTILNVNYQESKDQNEKHLAYVPNFKTILSLNWINKYYEVLMQNNYTAQRFTNTANSGSLAPYLMTNLKATYKHIVKSNQVNFSIGIDNLWNENFQEIQGAFMPLRNYYFNVTALLK
jgi:outer membrane cobalamin receptor